MNAPLRYSRDELMRSHPYARPHEAAGYRLHGGFVEDGAYVSPRTLVRVPAVQAWGEALQARGWPLIDASAALLKRGSYPNFEQHRFLLSEGLCRSLWNSLSITGIIEARGQALCRLEPPDFQALIEEDIGETATGHLGAGLFYAHGADEGGDPARPGEGAHDAMWFAARDLVFGKDAWPVPEAPPSISRDVEVPQLPAGVEQLVKLLMDVLMIEIGAEVFFALCCRIFRDPGLFTDRRADAELAAVMVERIRADEQIHVGYLQTAISEMRSFTWRGTDGRTWPGAEIIDPVWARMVPWHGETSRELGARRTREALESYVLAERGEAAGRRILNRFDALDARVAA
jgi:hypothetical protein